jgi:hypothetical protein
MILLLWLMARTRMETIMNCGTPSSPTLSSDTEPDGMQFEYAIWDLDYKIALGTVDDKCNA